MSNIIRLFIAPYSILVFFQCWVFVSKDHRCRQFGINDLFAIYAHLNYRLWFTVTNENLNSSVIKETCSIDESDVGGNVIGCLSDGDRFKMLVTESLCRRLFSLCWWFFNVFNRSATAQTCHKHLSYPTSVLKIIITKQGSMYIGNIH